MNLDLRFIPILLGCTCNAPWFFIGPYLLDHTTLKCSFSNSSVTNAHSDHIHFIDPRRTKRRLHRASHAKPFVKTHVGVLGDRFQSVTSSFPVSKIQFTLTNVVCILGTQQVARSHHLFRTTHGFQGIIRIAYEGSH